jgi:hypothetical protein
MKYLQLFGLLFIVGCFQKNNSVKEGAIQSVDSMAEKANQVDTIDGIGPQWANDLVLKYVKECNSEDMLAARNDSNPVEWMFDHVEPTDTAVYYVYHVGNDMQDHFATIGWVYIDSAKRLIYQYDVAGDSIYLWRK